MTFDEWAAKYEDPQQVPPKGRAWLFSDMREAFNAGVATCVEDRNFSTEAGATAWSAIRLLRAARVHVGFSASLDGNNNGAMDTVKAIDAFLEKHG